MASLNLVNAKETVVFGNDSVVIRAFHHGLAGGRVLDTTGYTEKNILAGHVVITDNKGVYKPMPIKAQGESYVYDSLPEGYAYAGVVYRSVPTNKPAVSVMVDGVINPTLLPYPIDAIKSAFVAACPFIRFEADELVDPETAPAPESSSASESSSAE